MKKLGIGVLLLVVCLYLSGCGCGQKFTVSFDADGGTAVSSVEVSKDETVSEPQDPTKDNYTFDGWYLDDVKYDFSTKVTKDITLKAKWVDGGTTTGETWTLTFDADGGNNVSSIKVNKGQKINRTLPTPTKDGYTFDGWYANGKKVDKDTVVTADMKLTAKWTKSSATDAQTDKVQVTFNSNGGTKVSSQNIEKGKTVVKPKDPTRSGYKFLGWYLNNKAYNFNTKVTAKMTLVAKWQADSAPTVKPEEKPEENQPSGTTTPEVTKYTVTFNTNGGTPVAAQTVESGSTVTRPTTSRDGYTFLGWYLNGSEYNFSTPVSSKITVEAKWEKIDVYTYEVTAADSTGMSPNNYVVVKKNGTNVTGTVVTAIYSTDGSIRLGKYNAAAKAIIVARNDVSKIGAVKVDGKLVQLQK